MLLLLPCRGWQCPLLLCVHTVTHRRCGKNHLCKEMAKPAIILTQRVDSAPFPVPLSLLKISNT